ncbi:Sir2 family histone deacetylase Hst4 [Tricharina praecox]|uniref:Sir2 family histone deacetylase Hst4 n=1 Tax=Tricharina praecox TaxID=43433 RepID=UPI002220158A|nr:Sir2 family histone deacetylase Hst4 [Tricharina praecox]KAI5855970.1 Sir2 family histone deacetylase Hst4 [Tricharina praecox]
MQKDAEPASNAKRQKSPPKPRETEFLDLRSSDPESIGTDQKRQLDTLMKLLRKKKKIVVIAGAGISVGAGIPDFRSSNGLFNTLRTAKNSGKDLFDASVYKDDDLTASFHDMVRTLHGMAAEAEPTEFHQLLATLATEGRLLRLYSQNVDCIDTRLEPLRTSVPLQSKGPWPTTIQVHGGLEKMNCSKCGWVGPMEPQLFVGAEPPDCRECLEMESVRDIAGKRSLGVGKLRPRIVLYNEFHPDAEAIGAVTEADIRARPDALIVVGTSLKVPGVKRIVQEMCKSVRGFRGGVSVWVNNHDPPSAKDYNFDLVVRGDCEKVATLASLPRWDSESDSSEESFVELDPAEERIHSQVEVQIIQQQLPSPSLSPDPNADGLHPEPVPGSKKRAATAMTALTKEKPVKRPRGRPAKAITAKKEPKKPVVKKAATIKASFKSVKQTPSTASTSTMSKGKAVTAKNAINPAPISVGIVDTPTTSSVSPPPSSIPSPMRGVITVNSLLN